MLIVNYLGYRAAEIRINPRNKNDQLVVELEPSAIKLEGMTITAEQAKYIKTEKIPSLLTLSPTQIATLPVIGQIDIFRSLQLLPGISATNDGSSGLYVRGGTPDQNLVLLDGMTVYHVDHFFGFFSAFNPDAIKDIQVYKGAFPSKFGGRLSSVVDMIGRTGNPDQVHGTFGASLISANATLGIPLSDLLVLVSARRSYADILSSSMYDKLYSFITGTQSPLASTGPRNAQGFGGGVSVQQTPTSDFSDVSIKTTYAFSPRSSMSLSYYGSLDEYDVSSGTSMTNVPGLGGGFRLPGGSNSTQQGNNGGSGTLSQQWSDALFSNIVLAYSSYASSYSSSLGSRLSDVLSFSTSENNLVNDLRFRVDNEWKLLPKHTLGFGLEASNIKVNYTLSGSDPNGGSRNLLNLAQQEWLSAIYTQDEWTVSDRFTVTGGLRLNSFPATKSQFVEPRLSARYELSENLALKAAFGVHHQFVNRILNENILQGSRDFWVLANDSLPPGAAIHYVLGASWENSDFVLDVEGYYKGIGNLMEFTQRFRREAVDTYSFLVGKGRIAGVEFLLQKKYGMFNGWISYTLSRSEKQYDAYNSGGWFPAETDQTHELKLIGNFSPGSGWNFSATFIYATGKPYTSPVSQYSLGMLDSSKYNYIHVSGMNAYRLPDYNRLDFSVTKKFRFETTTLDAGISLYNVFNHTNVSYYQYNLETAPAIITEVTGLGFLPTIFVQYGF